MILENGGLRNFGFKKIPTTMAWQKINKKNPHHENQLKSTPLEVTPLPPKNRMVHPLVQEIT